MVRQEVMVISQLLLMCVSQTVTDVAIKKVADLDECSPGDDNCALGLLQKRAHRTQDRGQHAREADEQRHRRRRTRRPDRWQRDSAEPQPLELAEMQSASEQRSNLCTDIPSPFMVGKGYECATWPVIPKCTDAGCKNQYWKDHKLCQYSCHKAGCGYAGDMCVAVVDTPVPTPAPTLAPGHCTDFPDPWMETRGFECATWSFIQECKPKNLYWRTTKACQLSLFKAGCPYEGDVCTNLPPTPQPTLAPTLAPGVCTDTPEPYMVGKKLECAMWSFIKTSDKCSTPDWKKNKYCQYSCYKAGKGYQGDTCNEGPGGICAATDFDGEGFNKCDWFGDPHWTASFFGKHFSFYGWGVFNVASTIDDSFAIQNFQCSLGDRKPSVVIALAVKTGNTTVFIQNTEVFVNGKKTEPALPQGLDLRGSLDNFDGISLTQEKGCSQMNVIVRKVDFHPGWYHDGQIRIKKENSAAEGLCGLECPREYVKSNEALFTASQLNDLCAVCNKNTPAICQKGKVTWPEPEPCGTPEETPEKACANANPPIDYADAAKKCKSLEGTAKYKPCIFDYCASNGDDTFVDGSEEEDFRTPEPTPPKCETPDWEDPIFEKCDSMGDPHWTKSFFGKHFEFYGVGVFNLGGTVDGSFAVQNFQCGVSGEHAGKSVSIAFAIKVGKSIVYIKGTEMAVDGKTPQKAHQDRLNLTGSLEDRVDGVEMMSPDGCSRINVNGRPMGKGKKPGWFHNVKLRIKSGTTAAAGLCGLECPREYVKREDSLFTGSQLKDLCSACDDAPLICQTGKVVWPEPEPCGTPQETPEDACKTANPPIAFSVAAKHCKSLKGTVSYNACIFDYCASDGDDTFVENVEEEKDRDPNPVPPPHTCPTSDWDDLSFSACDFHGDPHWTASFFSQKFNFYGWGVFNVASTIDGSFAVQNFQCSLGGKPNSVSIALAVKIGSSIVYIKEKEMEIGGKLLQGSAPDGLNLTGSLDDEIGGVSLTSPEGCSRINVNGRQTAHLPGWLHNVKIRIKTGTIAADGLCGRECPREYVKSSDALFTESQLRDLCASCSDKIPAICQEGATAWPEPLPCRASEGQTPLEACAAASPPIEISRAQNKCKSLKGSAHYDPCIFDFCASDGDDTFVENSETDATRKPDSSGHFVPPKPPVPLSHKFEYTGVSWWSKTCEEPAGSSWGRYGEVATASSMDDCAEICTAMQGCKFMMYQENRATMNCHQFDTCNKLRTCDPKYGCGMTVGVSAIQQEQCIAPALPEKFKGKIVTDGGMCRSAIAAGRKTEIKACKWGAGRQACIDKANLKKEYFQCMLRKVWPKYQTGGLTGDEVDCSQPLAYFCAGHK